MCVCTVKNLRRFESKERLGKASSLRQKLHYLQFC